jgi:hypothetical protein
MRFLAFRALAAAALVALTGGCATLTGEPTQQITIQTVDVQGRAVEGMGCSVINGSAQYVGDTPMFDLKVRRSSTPLVVECRRDGYPLARAVVVPRADNLLSSGAQLLLPGGTSMLLVDHFSGYMYSYPRWIRVQSGADMVFDRRDERGRDPTPGLITRQFDEFVRFAGGSAPSARAD